MKPMKGAVPIAKWLLRFSLITFIFISFFNEIQEFNFTDPNYLIAFGFILSAALIIIGGFLPRSSLTVIAGILIFLLSLFAIIWDYIENKKLDTNIILTYIFPAAIGFYFFARGNKG